MQYHLKMSSLNLCTVVGGGHHVALMYCGWSLGYSNLPWYNRSLLCRGMHSAVGLTKTQ